MLGHLGHDFLRHSCLHRPRRLPDLPGRRAPLRARRARRRGPGRRRTGQPRPPLARAGRLAHGRRAQPLLTAALAAATGTERAPRSAVIGSLASLGGVALIFYDRLEVSAQQATGVALMMAAVSCGTCMNVILKRKAGGLHPLAQNAWFLSIVGAAMTLLALAEGRPLPWPPPPGPTVALVYLALLGSVVAFAAYFYLLRHASLMTATTIMLVQPVIALLVDAVWEAQPISGLAYVGAAVTTSGVGVSLVLGRRALKAAPPAEPPKGAPRNETVV
ncbi:MAG: DMT family transporter [Polyangiaceae bacterium]|nr:DMT family transporter [Polyangiaceae bacterium]